VLAIRIVKFHERGGIGGRTRREQRKAASCEGPHPALCDFQVRQFDEPVADLAKVGRVIAAFGHAPEIILRARCKVLPPPGW